MPIHHPSVLILWILFTGNAANAQASGPETPRHSADQDAGAREIQPARLPPDAKMRSLVKTLRQGKEILGWLGKDAKGEPEIWFADGWRQAPEGETSPFDLVADTKAMLSDREHHAYDELTQASWLGNKTRAAWLRHLGQDALVEQHDLARDALWPPSITGQDFSAENAAWAIEKPFNEGDIVQARFYLDRFKNLSPAAFAASNGQTLAADLDRRAARKDDRPIPKDPPAGWAMQTHEAKRQWIFDHYEENNGIGNTPSWYYDEIYKWAEADIPEVIAFALQAEKEGRGVRKLSVYPRRYTLFPNEVPPPWRFERPSVAHDLLRWVSWKTKIPLGMMRVDPWPKDIPPLTHYWSDGWPGQDFAIPIMPDDMAAQAAAWWRQQELLSAEERLVKAYLAPQATAEEKSRLLKALLDSADLYFYLSPPHYSGDWISPHTTDTLPRSIRDPKVISATIAFAHSEVERVMREIQSEECKTRSWSWGAAAHDEGYQYAMTLLAASGRDDALAACRQLAVQSPLLPQRTLAAAACLRAGDPAPIRALAKDMAQGKPTMPKGPGEGWDSIGAGMAIQATRFMKLDPEASAALMPLAEAKHPWHDAIMRQMSDEGVVRDITPWALQTLASALKDETPLGTTWKREKSEHGEYLCCEGLGPFDWRIYENSPFKYDLEHAERRCDRAAWLLSDLVYGTPACPPQIVDRDERIQAIAGFFDGFGKNLRRGTPEEMRILGDFDRLAADIDNRYPGIRVSNPPARWLPDLKLLGHPATQDEFRTHQAVFVLGPGARLTPNIRLPAQGKLIAREAREDAEWAAIPKDNRGEPTCFPFTRAGCLIIQAEQDASGQIWFGIILDDDVRKVRLEEVDHIGQLAPAAD